MKVSINRQFCSWEIECQYATPYQTLGEDASLNVRTSSSLLFASIWSVVCVRVPSKIVLRKSETGFRGAHRIKSRGSMETGTLISVKEFKWPEFDSQRPAKRKSE